MMEKGKANRLLVLHDWLSDTTSHNIWVEYYQKETEICLVDLRGYGLSKEIKGSYTLGEIVADLEALLHKLNWHDYFVLGHSMTALAAELLAAKHPKSCKGVISCNPVPPTGAEIPSLVLKGLLAITKDPKMRGKAIVRSLTGDHYDHSFVDYKVKRWMETSTEEARGAYVSMFSSTNITENVKNTKVPILVIGGEFDAAMHQIVNLEPLYKPLYPKVAFIQVPSGHYPMQEVPALFVEIIDEFLDRKEA